MENIKMFDMGSEELFEIMDTARLHLIKSNVKYKRLQNEMSEIIEKYPNIDKVSDRHSTFELTKEECKMLQKVTDLYLKIRDFEEHEILFLGGKMAYIYFKKIGIIK
jgi:predicted transcriptional regulator